MAGGPHKPVSASKRAKLSQRAKRHLDELLDEALKETFPASDSLAMLELALGLAQAEEKAPSQSQPVKTCPDAGMSARWIIEYRMHGSPGIIERASDEYAQASLRHSRSGA